METTTKALKAAMTEHPAFVRWPNELYGVGQSIESRAGRLAIETEWGDPRWRA